MGHGHQLVQRYAPPLLEPHGGVLLAASFIRMDHGGGVARTAAHVRQLNHGGKLEVCLLVSTGWAGCSGAKVWQQGIGPDQFFVGYDFQVAA